MKARDIMTSPVITVGPDATVAEIAALLFERRISAVPVVEHGRCFRARGQLRETLSQ